MWHIERNMAVKDTRTKLVKYVLNERVVVK